MMVSAARFGFLAATPSLGAVLGNAALSGQPGPAATAALCVGWSALVTAGVFFPRLQMFGRILCYGPRGQNEVALTFDDGPNPSTTRRVLSMLEGTGHRATFFVLGDKARRHPGVVEEIRAAGHGLGVHGDWHDRMHSFRWPATVHREISSAVDAVQTAAGVRPRWFRPPIGHTSPTTLRGARRAGVTVVGWSSRGFDGLKNTKPDTVLRRVDETLTAGAIVLLHDAAEHDDFEPASLAILPELLQRLDARRLRSRTLDEWFP